jgi:glycosyltransferase involved in cell wall biosynthesis
VSEPELAPPAAPTPHPPVTRPRLTVVVLTCNSARTLGSCLDSLAAQDDPDFDVLIVDDDSTDATVAVAAGYAARLRISVARNGSHLIPRGRNIGLAASRTPLVAFVDSDDRAAPGWTAAIRAAFGADPGLALASGDLVPAHRTAAAQAIALNDDAVRRLAGRGRPQFYAGNCAVNREILPGPVFDEDFRFAEDLELAARLQATAPWAHLPGMLVQHYSRDTFRGYARQMWRYGAMKHHYAVTSGRYRWLDYLPLALLLASGLAAAVLETGWPLVTIPGFSGLEALFVLGYQRCPPRAALLSWPAWLVKNVAWSGGLGCAVAALAARPAARRRLRAKHPAAARR